MAVFVRTKRVTDPLNDKVKACICGHYEDLQNRVKSYVSSGSEHEADHHSSSSSSASPCLSNLIHGFLEEESDDLDQDNVNVDAGGGGGDDDLSDSERKNNRSSSHQVDYYSIEMIQDLLNNPKRNRSDSFRLFLQSHVSKAVSVFSNLRSTSKEIFRRKVMYYLRESGYNAGICKTKWESSGGLTAGNYEFIDVIKSDNATCQQIRYFVDVDFAGEFVIARPTEQYSKLLKFLPRVYIGRSEELKQIVKLMSEAAKRSLKSRELYLSPWRKNRYMQAKWFGPYKRTVNQIPTSMVSFPVGFEINNNKFAVKCQTSVGFNVVGKSNGNGRFMIPAATRTR